MSHYFPCKGSCEKKHNNKSFFWSYNLKPQKKHKRVKANFLIQWDKNSISHSIGNINSDELDSIEGYYCNCRIKLDRTLYARIKKIWRILKQTGPSHLKFDVSWECSVNKKQNYDETIEFFANQLTNYLESVSTLSPTKIIDANIESSIGIFMGLLKVIGESKHVDPKIDTLIQKYCTHIIEHYDSELDNLIYMSNKFSTNIQLFQERLELVKDGQNWKDVFLSKTSSHKEYKKPNVGPLKIEIKMNRPSYTYTKPYTNANTYVNKPPQPSNNTLEHIRIVQQTYENVLGYEPNTETLLHYVSILKKSGIEPTELQHIIESDSL